jgi:hypothetical protein
MSYAAKIGDFAEEEEQTSPFPESTTPTPVPQSDFGNRSDVACFLIIFGVVLSVFLR